MTTAEAAPARDTITLLRVSYPGVFGLDPIVMGWCDDTQAITIDGVRYAPDPNLDFELPEQRITPPDGDFHVDMPVVPDTFSDWVSNGYRFPRTEVFVEEIARPDNGEFYIDHFEALPVGSRLHLAYGILDRTERNPKKKAGIARLHCRDPMAALDNKTMGFQALQTCGHTLFGPGCEVDPNGSHNGHAFQVTDGHVTSIDGTRVTLTGTGITSRPSGFFVQGNVYVAGLNVKIRDWTASSNDFVLAEQIDPRLLNEPCRIFAGCNHTDPVCDGRFGNRERFGAYGNLIRDYNPQWELPR